jgi:hypothetical protein
VDQHDVTFLTFLTSLVGADRAVRRGAPAGRYESAGVPDNPYQRLFVVGVPVNPGTMGV